MLLLICAGASFIRKAWRNLRDMGPGFRAGNLVAFDVDPSLNGYKSDQSKQFFRQLSAELGAVPGVTSVGLAAQRILENNEWDNWMTIEGYHPKSTEVPDPFMNSISPGYFTTLAVPVLAGRDFTVQDTQMQQHGDKPEDTEPRVAIVNEKFAKRFFGSAGNAIDRHVGHGIDPGTKTDMEIIGVIKDIKYTNLRDEIPIQMFEPYLASDFVNSMTVYVRTAMNP